MPDSFCMNLAMLPPNILIDIFVGANQIPVIAVQLLIQIHEVTTSPLDNIDFSAHGWIQIGVISHAAYASLI